MKTDKLKGSLLVAAAACCYGMLGTFVKMAYHAGFTTAEVTVSQFTLGFLSLLVLSIITNKLRVTPDLQPGIRTSYLKMIFAGTSLGLTSICYYMAVKYIAVSLAIVLLLQAVWMSVVLESILKKKRPGTLKLFAVAVTVAGTILATGTLEHANQINWKGVGWGLFAATCYTATMYSSNHLQLKLPPQRRSFLMVSGGLIIVLITFMPAIARGFSWSIFLTWRIPVSLFGTILPPLLFTKGMPLTGMSFGAMLTSLEVPVSVMFARHLLGEPVSLMQWLGILLILAAVILINRRPSTGIV